MASSLIITRLRTAKVKTAIKPNPMLNKPSRNMVSKPTLGVGLSLDDVSKSEISLGVILVFEFLFAPWVRKIVFDRQNLRLL